MSDPSRSVTGEIDCEAKWIDLFTDYNARIELVYVEPPFQCLLRQNKDRAKSVPEEVVRKLAGTCEPPTWAEGHRLIVN